MPDADMGTNGGIHYFLHARINYYLSYLHSDSITVVPGSSNKCYKMILVCSRSLGQRTSILG